MKGSEHHSSKIVKLLYLGNSGAGKTGSLCSLIAAGYKLHIIDFDNGLDSLVKFIRRECPDKLDNLEYETVRDRFKATPLGPKIDGTPKAFVKATELLSKWSDGGADHVTVIDSGTMMGRSAFEWAKHINPTAKDQRNWFYTAQQAIENIIAMCTNEAFNTNFIHITHIQYQDNEDGTRQGFASSIGSALGPIIPTYFNTVVLAQRKGAKRTISTVPTTVIDLKNPAPFRVDATLPIETGMGSLFSQIKE